MVEFFESEKKIKTILWDFDGVIMDSMPVRDQGFQVVLSSHSKQEIEQLLKFHQENGGLSRYVKFRYFFEKIKNQKITDEEIQVYADQFSQVMLKNLLDDNLLISDSLNFIKANYKKFNMYIVSGSDQNELRHICKALKIDSYFNSIHGSPTPKKELVKNLMETNGNDTSSTILIGDSINDYEAAVENGILFYGYNNLGLKEMCKTYITKFC